MTVPTRPALLALLLLTMIVWPSWPAQGQTFQQDVLVKASGPAVYYYASDGKRYVFPAEGVYYSWFSDFSNIVELTDAELAAIPLGGNVTYRPGIKMVKIQSDSKAYAVDRGGMLRWVTSEAIAKKLYGSYWNKNIHDISDAYFVNYVVGDPIYLDSDYSPINIAAGVTTINADKGLAVSPSARQATTVPNVGDAATYAAAHLSGTVREVVDGDTFTLAGGLRVRLIGINAPETGQPYATEAKAELERLVLNQTVSLESDVSETDAYGRLLKYAYVSYIFVNKELVRLGLADSVAYAPDTAHQADLDAAELEARAQGRGMWAMTAGDYEFTMTAFHYNAFGNDNENLNDEYFILRNDSATAVDMNGWTVRDEASHVYRFPQFVLPSGTTVTIFTGSGINTATALYWNQDQAVWNNDGDTLVLSDAADDLVMDYTYE